VLTSYSVVLVIGGVEGQERESDHVPSSGVEVKTAHF
jgi:hypothetical protein